MRDWGRLLVAILLSIFFLPPPSHSGALLPETRQILLENIRAHQITILGEHHRRPESTRLLVELADALTVDGRCLVVGLELDTYQNAALDAFIVERKPVDAIAVSPIIDHSGFRDMLLRLRDLVAAGRCLELRGVDLPQRLWEEETTRDGWMAGKLAAMSREHPVLALLGNAHGLRVVRWESGKDDPQAAELLLRQGREVFSVMQHWSGLAEEGERTGTWYQSDHPTAHLGLRDLLKVRAVVVPGDLSVLADGVIFWE